MTTAEKTIATQVATANITRQTRDQYIVPSRTQIGILYPVRRINGQWQCSCDAAANGMQCWHRHSVERLDAARQQAQRAATRPDPAIGIALLTGK